MRRAAVVAVLATALLLAGCSSTSQSSSDGGAAQMAESGQLPDVAIEGSRADDASTGTVVAGPRDVVTTGQLDLVVDDPAAAATQAIEAVEAVGGRIDASTRQPANDYQSASASITARVPADELSDTLDDLADLGEVRNLSTRSDDVTAQTTDLDARIDSLTSSVERLRSLLSAATSTAELVDVETALSQREAELESLTAQREYLRDQVDYSTLAVSFNTVDTAPPAGPTDFWSAVVAGFTALIASLGALLIGLGAALPWLLFGTLLAAAVLLIVRLVRRARSRPDRRDDASV